MACPAPMVAVPDALQSTCFLPLSAPVSLPRAHGPGSGRSGGSKTLFAVGELAASRNPAAQRSSDGYLLWVGWVAVTGKLGFGEPRIGVASPLIDRVTWLWDCGVLPSSFCRGGAGETPLY